MGFAPEFFRASRSLPAAMRPLTTSGTLVGRALCSAVSLPPPLAITSAPLRSRQSTAADDRRYVMKHTVISGVSPHSLRITKLYARFTAELASAVFPTGRAGL